jgi:chorismate lyase/3-hydroxybenzoate synthase
LRGDDVLAVFGFGARGAATPCDPRYLHVPLQPHAAVAPFEVWRTDGPIASGRDGEIAWSSNGQLSFGVIEVEEGEVGHRRGRGRTHTNV